MIPNLNNHRGHYYFCLPGVAIYFVRFRRRIFARRRAIIAKPPTPRPSQRGQLPLTSHRLRLGALGFGELLLIQWKKNGNDSAAHSGRARAKRARKDFIRSQSGRYTGSTLAPAREFSALARVIHALRAQKIRFQIVGMSGAILQGVPATTLETDIWVDLPARVRISAFGFGSAAPRAQF